MFPQNRHQMPSTQINPQGIRFRNPQPMQNPYDSIARPQMNYYHRVPTMQQQQMPRMNLQNTLGQTAIPQQIYQHAQYHRFPMNVQRPQVNPLPRFYPTPMQMPQLAQVNNPR